eukprot:gnl/TRDRNA2_/TRDRNA2_80443_c0_seq1.p1 gnl/TRDRNA2_/TRDRNA2_80443_c0~~gnl/TRDRNA2_/TRDRNA2_80443_c0_seq1.p1  ORF type:complete len:505 (+),score=92.52 gnl/TRDRNA2_/TRDRNA2_80443_c0_seq1:75-1589(+)
MRKHVMHHVSVSSILTFVTVQAYTEQFNTISSNYWEDEGVDKLLDRALARRDAVLDNTMLGKSLHLTTPRRATLGRPPALRATVPSTQDPARHASPLPQPARVSSQRTPREHDRYSASPDGAPLGLSRRQGLTASLVGGLAFLPQPSSAEEAETSTNFQFTPKNDTDIYMPPASVAGQTILITGANSGLGLESAKRLGQAGAKLVITARTQAKADEALAQVKAVAPKAEAVALVLDLGSLESIKSFPDRYKSALDNRPIDVLLENAGVMAIPQKLTTVDGFEKQVGINHLGHFALVAEMLPVLRKAANGFRIVLVSSEAHRFASEESVNAALDSNLDPKVWPTLAQVDSEGYSQWGAYGLSKAANVLFANELQRRFDAAGIRASAVSLHPGGVGTGLKRYLVQGVEEAEQGVPMSKSKTYEGMNPFSKFLIQSFSKVELTVEQGANTQIFLAAGADNNGDLTKGGGKYFVDMKVGKPIPLTSNRALASKLWEVSERLTGTKIPI